MKYQRQEELQGAGGVVGMQVDGDGDRLLQRLDQRVGLHGQQQVGHVLDADGVRAHVLQFLGQLDEVGLAVDGRDGIAEGGLHQIFTSSSISSFLYAGAKTWFSFPIHSAPSLAS